MDNKAVDNCGSKLLDICKMSGLRILNGRSIGDTVGRFTCYSHNGNPSTIDYMLVHKTMLKKISYFVVGELCPKSIHCLIGCSIKIAKVYSKSNDHSRTTPLSISYEVQMGQKFGTKIKSHTGYWRL